MVAVLLLLLMLHCGLTAAFGSIEQKTSYHNVSTAGESGEKCTKIGRHCLTNASCVNKECVCPPGFKGMGTIECVEEDNLLCVVAADPHLLTYGRAKVDVNIPCQYRLTRFVTDHRSKATPFAFCAVEVYATNELNLAFYYVHSVHISIGIVDSGSNTKDVFEVHKYGTSDKKVFRYLSHMNHTRLLWGSAAFEQDINGVTIIPTFDSDNNFAVLHVPQCGVRVKYRAYQPDRHRQTLLPGISIMAPKDSQFVAGYGTYHESLCGTDQDSDTLFKDRAAELGLDSKHLAAIYDILNQAPPQIGNSRHAECNEAFKAFSESQDKAGDLNYCGKILSHTRTRKCILEAPGGREPIHIFNACIRFRSSNSEGDCRTLQAARDHCGKRWKGPAIECP